MIFFRTINISMSVLFCLMVACSSNAFGEEQSAIVSRLVLKVTDRDQVAELIIRQAGEVEGWFFSRTDEELQLKVPASMAKSFIDFVGQQGIVADRSYSSRYLGDRLSQRLASLKSRESLLINYFEVLKKAKQSSVLAVEQEVVALTEAIEKLKGEIRYLRHEIKYARINITFQFRNRTAPVADGNSSFPWLNTMSLTDLVRDFQNVHK